MPTHIKAEIVLQSVNTATGDVLTTFKLEYPRFLEAELNTHTLLRGSTSSSRAVNITKMNERIRQMSYVPEEWGANCAGMSAKEFMPAEKIPLLKALWEQHRDKSVNLADTLNDMGVHKQIVNRVTEPYQVIQKILTGTCWNNFFNLRDSGTAQPEMKELAAAMREEMEYFDVVKMQQLLPGQWHTPFVSASDFLDIYDHNVLRTIEELRLVSVARCARVSYLKDKDFSIEDDLKLAQKLYQQRHVKPFTHVAVALPERVMVDSYVGFMNLRKFIPDETNGDDLNVPILNGEQARERFGGYLPEGLKL